MNIDSVLHPTIPTPPPARLVPLLTSRDDRADVAAEAAQQQKLKLMEPKMTATYSARQLNAFIGVLNAMIKLGGDDKHSAAEITDVAKKITNVPGWVRLMRTEGFVTRQGHRSDARYSVSKKGIDLLKSLNGAFPEAKAPETPRQQTSFSERLATLDGVPRRAKSPTLKTVSPAKAGAQVTARETPPRTHETTYETRIAITDHFEVMIFDGPPDTTTPTVIPARLARRMVALFRTLPSGHELALES